MTDVHARDTIVQVYIHQCAILLDPPLIYTIQTLVLYRLYDQGFVKSLDDYLTTYCPDFQMQTEYNITLRQMAAQVSAGKSHVYV